MARPVKKTPEEWRKEILNAAQERNLLTASQRERCLLEIEKQHSLNQKRQRQA